MRIMTYKMPKYNTEPADHFFNNPKTEKAEEEMNKAMGFEDMPVGIYGDFVGIKGDPDIMEKTQYNIRSRFGYISEDDEMDENESEVN